MKTVIALALLIGGAGVLASCASQKQAIIYRDPLFAEYGVLKGPSAFLLWSPVDIQPVVQDMIREFDGDPHAGEIFVRDALVACFTGKCRVTGRSDDPYRFHLIDLASAMPVDSLRSGLTLTQDAYGVAQLTVNRRETVAAALASARADYLIVLFDAMVTRGATAQSPVALRATSGGAAIVGGGEATFASMGAQVIVLRAATMSIVWNGFVTGTHAIYRNFTKDTIEGVANTFAFELRRALE
jgi:hypothetical protein